MPTPPHSRAFLKGVLRENSPDSSVGQLLTAGLSPTSRQSMVPSTPKQENLRSRLSLISSSSPKGPSIFQMNCLMYWGKRIKGEARFGWVTPVAWETDPGETPGLRTESRSFEKLSQCAGNLRLGPQGQGAFPHFSLGGSYRLLSRRKSQPHSLILPGWSQANLGERRC